MGNSKEFKIFTGIEIEGKHKGLPTIFVEGVPQETVIATLKYKKIDIRNFKHIYFGARYKSYTNEPSELCLPGISDLNFKLPKDYIVSVEFKYIGKDTFPKKLWTCRNVNFVAQIASTASLLNLIKEYKIFSKELLSRIQIKIFDKEGVALIPLESIMWTNKFEYALLNDTLME